MEPHLDSAGEDIWFVALRGSAVVQVLVLHMAFRLLPCLLHRLVPFVAQPCAARQTFSRCRAGPTPARLTSFMQLACVSGMSVTVICLVMHLKRHSLCTRHGVPEQTYRLWGSLSCGR